MSFTAAPAIAAPETAATVNIAVLLLLSPVAGATVPLHPCQVNRPHRKYTYNNLHNKKMCQAGKFPILTHFFTNGKTKTLSTI